MISIHLKLAILFMLDKIIVTFVSQKAHSKEIMGEFMHLSRGKITTYLHSVRIKYIMHNDFHWPLLYTAIFEYYLLL